MTGHCDEHLAMLRRDDYREHTQEPTPRTLREAALRWEQEEDDRYEQ